MKKILDGREISELGAALSLKGRYKSHSQKEEWFKNKSLCTKKLKNCLPIRLTVIKEESEKLSVFQQAVFIWQ